jgi:hypothetical protein
MSVPEFFLQALPFGDIACHANDPLNGPIRREYGANQRLPMVLLIAPSTGAWTGESKLRFAWVAWLFWTGR